MVKGKRPGQSGWIGNARLDRKDRSPSKRTQPNRATVIERTCDMKMKAKIFKKILVSLLSLFW